MPTSPAISVCMSMYNAGPYLRECIDSVLAQTFEDFEFIIVDDGSEDDSAAIVASYADPRIRLIRGGHDYVASLNRSLDEARGRYVARMDADDVMHSERLARQFAYMEAHPAVDLTGGRMTAFRDDIGIPLFELYVREGRLDLADLLDGCCICHPTVMVRTDRLNAPARLRYRKEWVYAEDYDLWVEMLGHGLRLVNLPDIMAYYRLHPGQVTACRRDEQGEKSGAIRERALRLIGQLTDEAFAEEADVPASTKRLTVVMPFLNEGEEVGRTVRSIRETAGDSVDILVLNDDSDDGYDYDRDQQVFERTMLERLLGVTLDTSQLTTDAWEAIRGQVMTEYVYEEAWDRAERD